MTKLLYLCDNCSHELSSDEIYHQLYLHESPTTQIHLSPNTLLLCTRCATAIDLSLANMKLDLLRNASHSRTRRSRRPATTATAN